MGEAGGTTYRPSGSFETVKERAGTNPPTLSGGLAIPKNVKKLKEAVDATLSEKSPTEIDRFHSIFYLPRGKWNEFSHAKSAVE